MNAENLRVPENLMGRKIGILFPGQGIQTVGMGESFYRNSPAARKVFEEANGALGFDLARLCFEGPKNELLQTHNAQPAILTASIAALRVFEEKFGTISDFAAAGHSVGEYAALVAAGSLKLSIALRLVRERGHLMHKASKKQEGFMAAVMGLNESAVEEICQQTGTQIANVNSERQIVISGPLGGFAHASELSKSWGGKVIKLEVEGAFHSKLMEPAVRGMIEALNGAEINNSRVPVISNTSASPMRRSSEIRAELEKQIVNPVNWLKSMNRMREMGVEVFVEMGGTVLTGLAKRINKDLKAFSVSNVSDIQSLALNPST